MNISKSDQEFINNIYREIECYDFYKEYEKEYLRSYLEPNSVAQQLHKIHDSQYSTITDAKYSDKEYIKKISPLNYPIFIYENFINETNGKYKKAIIINLPTCELNGFTVLTPNHTPLIILDMGLCAALQMICFSYGAVVFKGKKSLSYFDSLESCFNDFSIPVAEYFYRYLNNKSSSDLIKGIEMHDRFLNRVNWADGENFWLFNNTVLLTRSIILYVICHEQAHHELGHLNEMNLHNYIKHTQSFKLSLSQLLTKELRNKEYEADKLALKLFLECNNRNSKFGLFNNLYGFLFAPLLFFKILSTYHTLSNYDETHSSHPSGQNRFLNLLTEYQKLGMYMDSNELEDGLMWDPYHDALNYCIEL